MRAESFVDHSPLIEPKKLTAFHSDASGIFTTNSLDSRMRSRVKLSGKKDTLITGGRLDMMPVQAIVVAPTRPSVPLAVTTTTEVGNSDGRGARNNLFFTTLPLQGDVYRALCSNRGHGLLDGSEHGTAGNTISGLRCLSRNATSQSGRPTMLV
jgi:hypothetical protein